MYKNKTVENLVLQKIRICIYIESAMMCKQFVMNILNLYCMNMFEHKIFNLNFLHMFVIIYKNNMCFYIYIKLHKI